MIEARSRGSGGSGYVTANGQCRPEAISLAKSRQHWKLVRHSPWCCGSRTASLDRKPGNHVTNVTTWQSPLSISFNCPADFLSSPTNWRNVLHFALAESSTTNPTCRELVTVELSPVPPIPRGSPVLPRRVPQFETESILHPERCTTVSNSERGGKIGFLVWSPQDDFQGGTNLHAALLGTVVRLNQVEDRRSSELIMWHTRAPAVCHCWRRTCQDQLM